MSSQDPPPKTPIELSADLLKFADDAKDFCKAMNDAGGSFSRAVDQADQQGDKRVEPLFQEWSKCYWGMKDVITHTSWVSGGCIEAVETFKKTVLIPLRDEKTDAKQKVAALDTYIKTLNGKDLEAQQLAELYIAQNRVLTALYKKMQDVASTPRAFTSQSGDGAMEDISALDAEITDLQTKIQVEQDRATKAGIVHVRGHVIGHVKKSTTPESVVQMADTLKSFHSETNNKIKALNTKIESVKGIEVFGSAIEEITAILKGLPATLNILCTKVARFGNFWATLKHDALQLRNICQGIVDDGIDEPEFILTRRIAGAETDYTTLDDALKKYKDIIDRIRF